MAFQQEEKNKNQIEDRYLSFTLGDERFAIELLQVKEVVGIPAFTRIPYVQNYFAGIMNLRGKVISVIDLRKKLNIKSNGSAESAVIICELSSVTMGIIVDSVDSVIKIQSESMLNKPNFESSYQSDIIKGIYQNKEEMVVFLDLVKALSIEDIVAIQNASKDSPNS